MKDLAPIALFCYNRLEVLKKTIEALQKNILAKDSELIIFSDGPKLGQEEKVSAVRNYINTIKGFNSIRIYESPQNKGLANSIIDGVTKIVNEYGKIIVLEDDLITSPYFLNYMNDALNMYNNDSNVACITGYTYPLKRTPFKKYPQSFFIRGAYPLSWGTWQRAWNLFETDGQKLLDEIKQKKLEYDFDFDNYYGYTRMLEKNVNGEIDSWAIRWYASCYLKNKLCLYLTTSVINHIGYGDDATHCKKQTKKFWVKITKKPINLVRIPTVENKEMKKLFIKYYRDIYDKNFYNNILERFFSIKNDLKIKQKILTIFNIKFKFKSKYTLR